MKKRTAGIFANEPAELLRLACRDLEFLRDHWSRGASEPEIIDGSVKLHKLLVEQHLQLAWNAFGFSAGPYIVVREISGLEPGAAG
jgi:hypothetical protein